MTKSCSLNYKKGVKDGLPIGLGYLAVSFAFGVAASKGMHFLYATLMSATNLTSAGQFAGTTVILAVGTVFELLLTQILINARYFLMGMSLSQRLDEKFGLLHRFLCAFGITDEIFAVAVSQRQPLTKRYFYGLILLPWVGWTMGTFLGAVSGDLLPTIVVSALSIALYAMFIAIIIPPALKNLKLFIVMGIAVLLSVAFYYVPGLNKVSTGIAYVVSALVAAVVGAMLFPVKGEDE